MVLDENDPDEIPFWETEAVESLAEGINLFKAYYEIFFYVPFFIHREYRKEVKEYLENLLANLTDDKGEHL